MPLDASRRIARVMAEGQLSRMTVAQKLNVLRTAFEVYDLPGHDARMCTDANWKLLRKRQRRLNTDKVQLMRDLLGIDARLMFTRIKDRHAQGDNRFDLYGIASDWSPHDPPWCELEFAAS